MIDFFSNLDIHYQVIIIAVAFIAILQIISVVQTGIRMWRFSRIFGGSTSYKYKLKSDESGTKTIGFEVDGGDNGNPYFQKINESINDYVGNNESIDFLLLKGTVDGTCDSIEEDIHTQIPIPLYLGLAGTMLGIIIGVGYLWLSGALESLLSVNPQPGVNNTEGIVVLLGGVAIAMICSIIGLAFTTICTWIFKGYKLSIEQRKNDLFAWMQQNLLPEVATDDMQAISKISRSLNNFNNTFKQHTDAFARTLSSVQTIMSQQKTLAETVAQMGADATNMAKANAIATQRLEKNAEKLDNFNNYLDSINGYVDEVHRFTENFKEETLRLGTLEEIRDFFFKEKKAIDERTNLMKTNVGRFDDSFKKTMKDLKESMNNETNELKKIIGLRTEAFDAALKQQKEMFENANKEIKEQMEKQLNALPNTIKAINELEKLPEQINNLFSSVEKANKELISELKRALPAVIIQNKHNDKNDMSSNDVNNDIIPKPTPLLPLWMKILISTSAIIITGCCVYNSYTTWQMTQEKDNSNIVQTIVSDSTTNKVVIPTDSIKK